MTKQEQYAEYLKTDYWKAVAEEVKRLAGYRCQVCNSPNFLAAHHRTYANRGKEMDNLGDLTCLCGSCHSLFHKAGKIGWAPKPKKAKRKKRKRRTRREDSPPSVPPSYLSDDLDRPW
jgi:5-methylcytosine-specific restriction endonuclease McrA